MFCPYCGKEIPDGAKFCGVCGQKIRPAGMQPRNTQQDSARQEGSTQTDDTGRVIGQQPGLGTGNASGRQPDSSKKKLIIFGVIAGVLVLAAVLVVVLFVVPSKADSYQEQIDLGEQYLAAEDYEQAIVAYTAAIEIDAQQTDAYMARAEAYIALALEEDAGGAGEEAEADSAAESEGGAGEDGTETDAENADGDTEGEAEEENGGDAAEDAEESGGDAGEADGEEDAGEADGEEAEDTAEDTGNTAAEENLDRALADYRTVIGLEPERTQAYIRAADIYTVYRADYESAEEILEEGLAANPDDEDITEALEEVEELIEEAEQTARYQAYYDKLTELQEEYGEAYDEYYSEWEGVDVTFLKGLFFAQLVDFNSDGQEELLLAFGRADNFTDYSVQVWAYTDSGLTQVFDGDGLEGNDGGLYYVCKAYVDGKWYLVEKETYDTTYFWGMEGDEFIVAKSIGDVYGADDAMTVDGETVDAETYVAAEEKWEAELEKYCLCSDEGEAGVYEGDPVSVLESTLETLQSYLEAHGGESAQADASAEDSEAGDNDAAEAVNVFSVIPDTFDFSSGVGAWATKLYLNDDGTFTGKYFDDDMGDTGEDYPNGTEYLCNFSGSFGEAEQIDEYTWSVKLLSLETEGTPGEVYYEDGVRYILGSAYGLASADTLMIYLPGKPCSEIPQEFLDWIQLKMGSEFEDTLPDGFYGLYNVSDEVAFTANSDD